MYTILPFTNNNNFCIYATLNELSNEDTKIQRQTLSGTVMAGQGERCGEAAGQDKRAGG